jgi:hypothetical protein
VEEPLLTRAPGAADHDFACHFPLERWPLDEEGFRRSPAVAASSD